MRGSAALDRVWKFSSITLYKHWRKTRLLELMSEMNKTAVRESSDTWVARPDSWYEDAPHRFESGCGQAAFQRIKAVHQRDFSADADVNFAASGTRRNADQSGVSDQPAGGRIRIDRSGFFDARLDSRAHRMDGSQSNGNRRPNNLRLAAKGKSRKRRACFCRTEIKFICSLLWIVYRKMPKSRLAFYCFAFNFVFHRTRQIWKITRAPFAHRF